MSRTPVTLVSGFLGAGKTSLVNHLLAADHGLRLAVFVNDFGALGVDAELIDTLADGVLSLANGCICCSMQSDLVGQVDKFLEQRGAEVDALLIEASGVSNPANIVRALGYPALRERTTLAGIVAVVDAEQFGTLAGPARRLAEEQIACADLVVVNKVDLATKAQVAAIRDEWQRAGVRFVNATHGAAPWVLLLDSVESPHAPSKADPVDFHSWSWRFEPPLRYARLKAVLGHLPESVYRAKGFARLIESPDERCLVQVVGRRVEISRYDAWAGRPATTLTFIATAAAHDWTALARALNDTAAGAD